MMKTYLLSAALLLMQIVSLAQPNDSLYTVIQTQHISKGLTAELLSIESGEWDRKPLLILRGTNGTEIKRVDLKPQIRSTGNPINNISMQFVDAKTGFIYGNEVGYGIWPFVFKTTDGGTSWERVALDAKTYGPEIARDQFRMVDCNNGILLGNQQGETTITWHTTSDGGDTWKEHSLKPGKPYDRIRGSLHIALSDEATGAVTLEYREPKWRKPEADFLFRLQSMDFGKTFELLE